MERFEGCFPQIEFANGCNVGHIMLSGQPADDRFASVALQANTSRTVPVQGSCVMCIPAYDKAMYVCHAADTAQEPRCQPRVAVPPP